MYMITPKDHMSHDLSYFSGPSTSGAERREHSDVKNERHTCKKQVIVQIHKDMVIVKGGNHISKHYSCIYTFSLLAETPWK